MFSGVTFWSRLQGQEKGCRKGEKRKGKMEGKDKGRRVKRKENGNCPLINFGLKVVLQLGTTLMWKDWWIYSAQS